MKVVTDVLVKEFPDQHQAIDLDVYTRLHCTSVVNHTDLNSDTVPRSNVGDRERITTRSFVNQNNEYVVLGMTKEVEDTLGLPFRIFENLRENNEQLKEQNYRLTRNNQHLMQEWERNTDKFLNLSSAILNMSFWQRLKFLFTGTIPNWEEQS